MRCATSSIRASVTDAMLQTEGHTRTDVLLDVAQPLPAATHDLFKAREFARIAEVSSVHIQRQGQNRDALDAECDGLFGNQQIGTGAERGRQQERRGRESVAQRGQIAPRRGAEEHAFLGHQVTVPDNPEEERNLRRKGGRLGGHVEPRYYFSIAAARSCTSQPRWLSLARARGEMVPESQTSRGASAGSA